MKKDIVFCIILYKKHPLESMTLKSIMNLWGDDLQHCKVVIFNNGPDYFESSLLPGYVTVHDNLINGSLSKLYNKCIDIYSDYGFIFLDDDTSLTREYVQECLVENEVAIVPKVTFEGDIIYPIGTRSGIQSITSGLFFPNQFILHFKTNSLKVFDENLDLYGIDTAFFYTLNRLKLPYSISESSLEHDLSHLSSGSNEFRDKEVLLANSAMLFKYCNRRLLIQYGWGVIRYAIKLNFRVLYSVILSTLSGKVIRF